MNSCVLIVYPQLGGVRYFGPFATAELARYYAEGNWTKYDIKALEKVT